MARGETLEFNQWLVCLKIGDIPVYKKGQIEEDHIAAKCMLYRSLQNKLSIHSIYIEEIYRCFIYQKLNSKQRTENHCPQNYCLVHKNIKTQENRSEYQQYKYVQKKLKAPKIE